MFNDYQYISTEGGDWDPQGYPYKDYLFLSPNSSKFSVTYSQKFESTLALFLTVVRDLDSEGCKLVFYPEC